LQHFHGEEVLSLWVRHHPHPVLLDLTLPGLNGVTLLKKLRASHPEARVLMLTASEDRDDALAAMDAGATGPLARRELEVLGMVSQGVAYDDIGARLGITERTVRAHVVSA
jgi:DNA-binding NarL/FixJ family response regulator